MLTQITPTKIYLPDDEASLAKAKELLTYHDKTIDFQLKKFKHADWFRQRYGEEAYQDRLDELKAQRMKCLIEFDEHERPYTYSGFADFLADRFETTIDNKVQYPGPKALPWYKAPSYQMYPYQVQALEKLLAIKHGAVSIATGLGKSFIIVNVIKRLGLKTLVMTPSTSISEQLYKELLSAFGPARVGAYFDGKKQFKKQIVVANGQSLVRLDPGSPAYQELSKCQVFVSDECFPCETGVITESGVRSIGSLVGAFDKGEPLPRVLSFNEQTHAFEYKRVLAARSVPMHKKMMRINFDNASISSSLNHPYLTRRGWVKASDLVVGDVILGRSWGVNNAGGISWNEDQKQVLYGSYLGDGSLSKHRNKYRLRCIHGGDQEGYLRAKAGIMGVDDIEALEKNGYAQKRAVRFTTKLFHLPFEIGSPKTEVPQGLIDELGWCGVAIWFMDDGAKRTSKYKGADSSEHAVLYTCSFSKESVEKLIEKLNSMGAECSYMNHRNHGKDYPVIRFSADGFRTLSRNIAPYVHPELQYKLSRDVSASEIGSYHWNTVRKEESEFVVRETLEYEPKIHSSRNQRLNKLYDLEVEDTHNFLVSSDRHNTVRYAVIAHNCHCTPAATFKTVCFGVAANAPYRFFFSATQMRNDGSGLLLQGITGPIVYEMSAREGVDGGYLAKPVFRMIDVESNSSFDRDDAIEMTRQHLFYNDSVNKIAADIANKSVSLLGHPVLILVEEMEQFTKLYPYLRHKVAFAHGGVTKDNADKLPVEFHKSNPNQLVEQFNAGEIPILIGTSCVSTGTNFKAVKTLIYLQGGKSEIQVRQAIGRSTRLVEGKTTCAIYDFHVTNINTLSRHATERKAIYNDIYGPVQEVIYG